MAQRPEALQLPLQQPSPSSSNFTVQAGRIPLPGRWDLEAGRKSDNTSVLIIFTPSQTLHRPKQILKEAIFIHTLKSPTSTWSYL